MHRRSPPLRLVAFTAALLAAGCGTSERFVAIGSCNAAHSAAGLQRLAVDGQVGSITITPSAGDEVAVTAAVSVRESLREKFPAADAARDLKVVVEGDALRVADAHVDDARDGGRNDFEIDFTITAPARLAWKLVLGVGNVDATAAGNALAVTTGVGNVRLHGAAAAVHASSGTGNLDADLETLAGGSLDCGTGNLRLAIARGGIGEKLACTSGTGQITISLPAGFSADVALETGTGHVSIEGATLEAKKNFVGGSARGKLGQGGPALVATSGTGGVTLRVRS